MNRSVPHPVAPPFLLAALLLAPAAHAQSAVDEHAIIAAASTLDAAIDGKDWERARELLLDEVTVALPDEEPGTIAADTLVARWQDALHAAKTTFHLRGSERVTFDGADSAVLRSKAHVATRVDGVAGDDLHELWADYHHELDRTENGWRVRHYGLVPRLERGNIGVIQHRLAATPAAGNEPEVASDGDTPAPEGDADGKEGNPATEAGSEAAAGAGESPPDEAEEAATDGG